MEIRKFIFYSVITVLTLTSPKVQAEASDKDYEEVSYSDLVNQLSQKNRSYTQGNESAFDKLKIHTGLGYINSFNNYNMNGRSEQRYQNGIQIGLGVDLLSSIWYGEIAYRNYGITNRGNEELLTRELDLKFGYHEILKNPIELRFQGGLANRYVRITDSTKGIDINEITPALMGSAGIGVRLNKMLTMGFDLSGHTSVINKAADQNSFEMIIDMKASL